MKLPSLILISGYPASGKSTIAKEVANHFNLPIISKDDIKEFLSDNFQIVAPSETKELNDFSRSLVPFFAGKILRTHQSVVVDMNFNRESDADDFKKRVNVECKIVQIVCEAPRDLIIQRFRDRALEGNRHKVHPETQSDPEQFMSNFLDSANVVIVSDQVVKVNTTDFEKVDYVTIFKSIQELIAQ
jgi:predicted kinase